MKEILLEQIKEEKDIFKKHLLFSAWLSKELKKEIDINYLKNRAKKEQILDKLMEILDEN